MAKKAKPDELELAAQKARIIPASSELKLTNFGPHSATFILIEL
jgi:hypothetical protein